MRTPAVPEQQGTQLRRLSPQTVTTPLPAPSPPGAEPPCCPSSQREHAGPAGPTSGTRLTSTDEDPSRAGRQALTQEETAQLQAELRSMLAPLQPG